MLWVKRYQTEVLEAIVGLREDPSGAVVIEGWNGYTPQTAALRQLERLEWMYAVCRVVGDWPARVTPDLRALDKRMANRVAWTCRQTYTLWRGGELRAVGIPDWEYLAHDGEVRTEAATLDWERWIHRYGEVLVKDAREAAGALMAGFGRKTARSVLWKYQFEAEHMIRHLEYVAPARTSAPEASG